MREPECQQPPSVSDRRVRCRRPALPPASQVGRPVTDRQLRHDLESAVSGHVRRVQTCAPDRHQFGIRNWHLCAGWAQRDEGMASDELAECGIGAKVTPSEDGGGKPNPSGVATPERDDDGDGFVFAEEAVFGYEAVTGDADFSGRAGVEVVTANRRRVPNPRRSRPRRCRDHRRGSSPPCRAADRSCDRRARASETSGPASSPGRGDTAAAASGTPPARAVLACGEGRATASAAWRDGEVVGIAIWITARCQGTGDAARSR